MGFEFESADGQRDALPYEPHLSFTATAWQKLTLLTLRSPFEIGGLGYVMPNGADFVLEDLFVVHQDVDDITTRLDPASVGQLLVELIDQGQDPSNLKLWWHSHAAEEVFWSGEDDATIDRFRNDGMISLVTNHRLKALARLDRYEPRQTTWVWVDRPTVASTATIEEETAIDAEIAAKAHPIRERSRPESSS